MSRAISFLGDYPWLAQPGGRRNRPYSEVELPNTCGGPNLKILMIVDTGADHMLLDKAWLASAGYGPSTFVRSRLVSVASGGNLAVEEHQNVPFVIEGNLVTLATVYAASGASDLLGLSAILSATNVGFDNSGWLYT